VANLHAKFEVSSFNRSRDMEGVPKFQKVGHVTPFDLILHFFYLGPLVTNLRTKFEVSSFKSF